MTWRSLPGMTRGARTGAWSAGYATLSFSATNCQLSPARIRAAANPSIPPVFMNTFRQTNNCTISAFTSTEMNISRVCLDPEPTLPLCTGIVPIAVNPLNAQNPSELVSTLCENINAKFQSNNSKGSTMSKPLKCRLVTCQVSTKIRDRVTCQVTTKIRDIGKIL